MKASELRIGNLFDFTADGEGYLPVEQIIKDDKDFGGYCAVFRNGSFKWLIETDEEWNIQPIPLTEEWLLKFGFEKIQYNYNLNDMSMAYHYELNKNPNWRLYFDGRCFSINDSKLIKPHLHHNKYVHQLQNLYFALTGKELQITENEKV